MKSVIIIDDDAILTRHYKIALEMEGFQVSRYHDHQLVDESSLSQADLITCDLMMPDALENEDVNELTTGLRFIENN